ncbi:MBL fold metallo-hydrolase [Micromonospora terminaliae]|uniref:MBL fold metallo-hydrolase n=1 Tax=Micromonospora terminaliae TaxID=1914461 RepID=A0AAJ2ZBM2_9ACTN|nr:MBL fold metallo-hydrolase [Micromonospora terminaliae]NES27237.1 MBL fold metallo-hydrolase [Micromonospora terminaliae]QGL48008.1 MBL fold metallo-hydrolase [Micromonospora terminaliae]
MARTAAVPLAPGVWRIPTVGRAAVNSYAFLDDDGSVTLVDCGMRRAPARIVRGLAAIGKTPADVTRIVLTHAHADHAGGAAELARRTGAPVAAHGADLPYAESGRVPPQGGGNTVGRLLTRLVGGRFPAVAVARPLADGDLLPVGGGLRVVHTPGHSPGHVSLLHEPTRVLVTGDALFNVAGVRWPVRSFCTDFRMTQRTAHVLGELDYDVAAFTHGPELTDRAREQVRAFLRRLG